MKNYVQQGEILEITAAANAVSGDLVIVNQMFGIATHDALSGEKLRLKLGGVFTLPKLNAASMSMAVGENVYWHASGSNAVANATNNTRIGVCAVAVGNTATSVRVRLNDCF